MHNKGHPNAHHGAVLLPEQRKGKRAMIDQSTIIGVTQGSVLHALKTNNLFPQCERVSEMIS